MNLFGSISGEYKLCCFSEYAPDGLTLGTYDQEIEPTQYVKVEEKGIFYPNNRTF